MQVVLDTNVLCDAVIASSISHVAVMASIPTKHHRIVLDHDGRLLKQYRDNLSRHLLFRKWYLELQMRSLIDFANGHLIQRIAQDLTVLGLHEPEDHVIVSLAINSSKYIITEDSDFGKGPSPRALDHQDVLTHLKHSVGLTLHDATEASHHL